MDQSHIHLLVKERQQRAIDQATDGAVKVDLFGGVVAGLIKTHKREDAGPAETLEGFDVS